MFNSKAFCVIVVLSTLVLGASLYFQTQEMMEYGLLTKLDKQYLSGTFTGGGGAAEPEPAKEEEDAKKDADAAKKDDKK
jgi:hypothetical protein